MRQDEPLDNTDRFPEHERPIIDANAIDPYTDSRGLMEDTHNRFTARRYSLVQGRCPYRQGTREKHSRPLCYLYRGIQALYMTDAIYYDD